MPKQKTLNELLPVVKSHQQKLAKEAKVILTNESKHLFENFPDVEGIRWTQRLPLENSELAPFHKSDFCIDQIQYKAFNRGAVRSNFEDDYWVSPWNDNRLESPDFLNSLTQFEQELFNAESALATAIGQYDRVTITRDKVTFEEF